MNDGAHVLGVWGCIGTGTGGCATGPSSHGWQVTAMRVVAEGIGYVGFRVWELGCDACSPIRAQRALASEPTAVTVGLELGRLRCRAWTAVLWAGGFRDVGKGG